MEIRFRSDFQQRAFLLWYGFSCRVMTPWKNLAETATSHPWITGKEKKQMLYYKQAIYFCTRMKYNQCFTYHLISQILGIRGSIRSSMQIITKQICWTLISLFLNQHVIILLTDKDLNAQICCKWQNCHRWQQAFWFLWCFETFLPEDCIMDTFDAFLLLFFTWKKIGLLTAWERRVIRWVEIIKEHISPKWIILWIMKQLVQKD